MNRLAINGGERARTIPIAPWPQPSKDLREMKALEKVLKSGLWGTMGPEVKKFEKRFSEYQQSKYGLGVTNGTTTLEIILRALGIGFGDEVILPPYTFYATASAVVSVCATPVFVDIESDTYNIDPEAIEQAITKKTKAIIPVHIGGRSCNMDRIMEIAKKHDLFVVEDCAQAHGSEWRGQRVGSIGDAGSFSFQNSKNLTSGEGGFITTNNQELFEKMWSIHCCGRDYKDTGWYVHHNNSTNARLTDWQGAVLDVQMDQLDEQINNREENAKYLNSLLNEIPFVEPFPDDPRVTRNTYHLFIFKYKSELCKGLPRDKFLSALMYEGVLCTHGYINMYKQPVFNNGEVHRVTGTKISYKDIKLENADIASEKEGVWFPQNVLLGDKECIKQTADAIIKIYDNVDELL